MTTEQRHLRRFRRAWRRLATQGACDGIGGAEYRRVRAEWEAAGRPTTLVGFICDRANIGPVDR